MSNTPREEQNIAEAIAAAQVANEASSQTSLWASAIQMGELYVALKNMGVREEDILDLIRIPFMFAAAPNKPEMVTQAVGDIDAKKRGN